MFIGHFAVGFAAKRVAPRTSLATLVAAASFLDIAWPILVLVGIESVRIDPGNTAFTPLDFTSYPWTHSLVMAVLWGIAFALVYRARTGYARGAWALAALVPSHWVLDWISHRPDLPLVPGASSRYGLGLWRSVPATLAVEGAMFAAGVAVYLAATRARKLRQHGLDEDRVWRSALNGRGPWWNAGASHMNAALPSAFFTRMGLVSLVVTHRRLQCVR